VIFGNFLGGSFITRVSEFLESMVNVSEFLQSFHYLNGYSVLLAFC
jgi:hypothetical protein